MKKGFLALGVAIGTVAFAYTAAAAQGVKKGRWSMTMTVRAEGMEEEAAAAMKEMDAMPPEEKAMMQHMMGSMGMTTTPSQCLTDEKPVPLQEGQEDCQATHAQTGDTVNFTVVCPEGTSSGQVTYRNDSMQGTIQATQMQRGQPSTATIDISGHYEGPCE
jgi:hypothetical protein